MSADGDPAVPREGCFAVVAAPEGSGREVAEMGWVVAEPSTFRAVIDAAPWTVRTSVDGLPAVPGAGCLAAVAAPAGRADDDTTTAPVFTAVILASMLASEVFAVS